jgi:hypothetical protein
VDRLLRFERDFGNCSTAPFQTDAVPRRWKTRDGIIFEWDSQHGVVEKYNKRGKHLGEFDPETGEQTKSADATREVEP